MALEVAVRVNAALPSSCLEEPSWAQGLRSHLPQSHEKKDFRQIKGHIHSETGLVDGSDGL